MRTSMICLAALALAACNDKDAGETGHDSGHTHHDEAIPDVAPADAQSVDVGATVTYTAAGLDDDQAYRATLVIDGNVTVTDGSGVFIDADDNGIADAGASTTVATITSVNGEAYGGSKTVPGTDDDPLNPSGIWPVNGEISVDVTAVGAGTVWLVVYENGGGATLLELGDDGAPTENHGIGGSFTVSSDGWPDVTPAHPQTGAVDAVTAYTISDVDDAQAYRVTLVVADNVTADGPSGTFVDGDANGAADAGTSEAIAVITSVNGEAIDASKTWPSGDDDPANPSGIYPVDGQFIVEISGVAAGVVYPVAYENGGTSTFLEIDAGGAPTEVYGIGGSLTIE